MRCDFRARMDWCVKPRSEANHAPVAVCNSDATRAVLTEHTRSGSTLKLDAAGSRDPDGHELRYHWWVYPEAGTYRANPQMAGADSPRVSVTLPPESSGYRSFGP